MMIKRMPFVLLVSLFTLIVIGCSSQASVHFSKEQDVTKENSKQTSTQTPAVPEKSGLSAEALAKALSCAPYYVPHPSAKGRLEVECVVGEIQREFQPSTPALKIKITNITKNTVLEVVVVTVFKDSEGWIVDYYKREPILTKKGKSTKDIFDYYKNGGSSMEVPYFQPGQTKEISEEFNDYKKGLKFEFTIIIEGEESRPEFVPR